MFCFYCRAQLIIQNSKSSIQSSVTGFLKGGYISKESTKHPQGETAQTIAFLICVSERLLRFEIIKLM